MYEYLIITEDQQVLGVNQITEEDKDYSDGGLTTIIRTKDQTTYIDGEWFPIKEYKQS